MKRISFELKEFMPDAFEIDKNPISMGDNVLRDALKIHGH